MAIKGINHNNFKYKIKKILQIQIIEKLFFKTLKYKEILKKISFFN